MADTRRYTPNGGEQDPPLQLQERYERLCREHDKLHGEHRRLQIQHEQLLADLRDPSKLLGHLSRLWTSESRDRVRAEERMRRIEKDIMELNRWKGGQVAACFEEVDLITLEDGEGDMNPAVGTAPEMKRMRGDAVEFVPTASKKVARREVLVDLEDRVELRMEAAKTQKQRRCYGVEEDVASLY